MNSKLSFIINNKVINKCYYATFISTFVWGLLAHGYAMSNASLMYFDNLKRKK